MESDVTSAECTWRVDEEDEAKYNFSDEKGLWQPKPEDILSMFDQLSKGGALPLQWKCPGRRAPESEEVVEKEETDMEIDKEECREEEAREPEPCAFDFDDTPSESNIKTTPIRALGGPGRTPRTEKRVARMDTIMDSLRKQQIQRAAEREARRAKASPGRTPQGRGRLLKFGSPPAQSPKISVSGDSDGKKFAAPIFSMATTAEAEISPAQPSVASMGSDTSTSTASPADFTSSSSNTITTTTMSNISKDNQTLNVNSENGNLPEKERTADVEGSKASTTTLTPSLVSDSDPKPGEPISSQSAPEVSTPALMAHPTTTAATTVLSTTINPDQIPTTTNVITLTPSSTVVTTTSVTTPKPPSTTVDTVSTSASLPLPSFALPSSTSSSSIPPPPQSQSTTNVQNTKPEIITPSTSSLSLTSTISTPQTETEAVPSTTVSSSNSGNFSAVKTEPPSAKLSLVTQTVQAKVDTAVSESPSEPEDKGSMKESS